MSLSVTGAPALNPHSINNAALGEVSIKWKSDGKVMNGMHTIDIEFSVEYEKEDKPILGLTHKEQIKLGSSGSFSGTFYDVTSEFRVRAQKYQDEGLDELFDMTIVQYDPNSDTGRQSITYFDCNLDSILLSKLDIGSTDLQAELEGTFSSFKINEEYKKISGLF